MASPLLLRQRTNPRGYSPKLLTPAAWYDAKKIALADGASVAQWDDQSGNGRHMVQAVSLLQPVYRASQDGFPAVQFDGTDDYLAVASAFLTSAGAGCIWLVLWSDTFSGGSNAIFGTCDELSTTRVFYSLANSGTVFVVQRNNDTQDTLHGGLSILANSNWYLIQLRSDGSATAINLDGTEKTITVSAGANTGDWWGDTSARDNTTLGCVKTTVPTFFFKGYMREVIMVDGATTADQRKRVRRYLARKWRKQLVTA